MNAEALAGFAPKGPQGLLEATSYYLPRQLVCVLCILYTYTVEFNTKTDREARRGFGVHWGMYILLNANAIAGIAMPARSWAFISL